LLPNLISTSVYSVTHRKVNALNSLSLHARQHVAVQIERNRNARMPQPLLRDFRVDTRGQQMRRMAMAQIMQSHARQLVRAEELFKRMGEAARLQGPAIGFHHNVMIVGQSHAEFEKVFCLSDAVCAQFVNRQ